MSNSEAEIVIVGAGLSGLVAAQRLVKAGITVRILEARDRSGGRILSTDQGGTNPTDRVDLGPAWFWPGQPNIQALARHYGLGTFRQFEDGHMIIDRHNAAPYRHPGHGLRPPSLRMQGGLMALTDALTADLPTGTVAYTQTVTAVHHSTNGVAISVAGEKSPITARSVILALPPRLISALHITPAPSATLQAWLAKTPTWMGYSAKFVAIYDRPFWRAIGLSGDAVSERGPLVQIHDASPMSDTGVGALFGFVGPSAAQRHVMGEAALKDAALNQLARLFGAPALEPVGVDLKDWSTDTYTSHSADAAPLAFHPDYGARTIQLDGDNGRVLLAGTESAQQHGGLVEGAILAGVRAADAALSKQAKAA